MPTKERTEGANSDWKLQTSFPPLNTLQTRVLLHHLTTQTISWQSHWDPAAGLEIMVYLGILVTRKFLGSQKILTELTAMITQKMLCPMVFLRMCFHFSVKMSYSTTR